MRKQVVLLYLIATDKEANYLYVRLPEDLIQQVFNALHDEGYSVRPTNETNWEKMVNLGRSYRIENRNDIITLKANKLALLQRNEK